MLAGLGVTRSLQVPLGTTIGGLNCGDLGDLIRKDPVPLKPVPPIHTYPFAKQDETTLDLSKLAPELPAQLHFQSGLPDFAFWPF